MKAIIGLGCKCLRELFLHLVPCRFHPVPQSLVALKPLFAKYGIGMTGLLGGVELNDTPPSSGDERLLTPGWAGDLSEDELVFIQERLRRSRRSLRLWKIATRDCPENAIRQAAF